MTRGLALALLASLPMAVVGAEPEPEPSRVGTAEIVLPGFTPLALEGRLLRLGAGRTYDFDSGLLPVATAALDSPLTGAFGLEFIQGNAVRRLGGGALRITAATPHHVQLAGTRMLDDTLTVEVVIRVEYDGLATVDLTLRPAGRVSLGGLVLTVPVRRTPDTRLLAYDPESINTYTRAELYSACKPLAYKNVLGVTDTTRALWLISDEPALRSPPARRPRTELTCTADEVVIRQPLLEALTLAAPVTIQFAFLATPVKELPGSFRRDRVIPNAVAGEERVGTRNLWWVEAMPHYALPWPTYPPGAQEQLTAADRLAWPGLKANRQNLAAWRRLGVERVPYMSLRAPSVLDPEVLANEPIWRAQPPVTTPAVGDGPYRQGFGRPYFSHRAPGFSDYLLSRLDGVLAELPVRGFYFDQGVPLGSSNPRHLTADVRIRPSQASDILAMRAFFKRLATAIHVRGREPLIYVHNSTATAIPAFTFVTGLVQGEEFNSPRLKGLNYQNSVDYELLQSAYTSAHSGIPVIWLEELWSAYHADTRPTRFRSDTAAWLKSREYEVQWRNFMSLALLHDALVWTNVPQAVRLHLYRQLDDFGVARSIFRGYWLLDPEWRTRLVLVSLYERADGRRLAIIVNRGQAAHDVTVADLTPFLGASANNESAAKLLGKRIPPQDFLLAVL